MPETERIPVEKPQGMETPRVPERRNFEQPVPVRPEQVKAKPREVPSVRIPAVPSPQAPAVAVSKTEARRRIERVMEDGLGDVYKNLPPAAKQKFREEGERAAAEIETLMYKVKIQTKKIFKLIFLWLRTIPGVNKYFLEQEAKLKTDEIIKIKEEMERNKSEQNVW